MEGNSDDPDTSISMPSDSQLWRQVVGEKKGRVYGMGSQAQTMWSAVHHSGGSSSSQREIAMEKKMDALQESVDNLMQCFRQISHMQQPPMPYAPWMMPPMPYPPSQMPPPPSQMPPPPSQMPPPPSEMPPPTSQMPSPPSQMPPPYYYPWMQPPPGQHPTTPYPWMQPPYPSVWPHYPEGQSHTRPQGQIPTNENVIEEEEEEEENLGL